MSDSTTHQTRRGCLFWTGIICGAVVGLLCAILLVMFIVYRLRKKQENIFVAEKSQKSTIGYTIEHSQDMYA